MQHNKKVLDGISVLSKEQSKCLTNIDQQSSVRYAGKRQSIKVSLIKYAQFAVGLLAMKLPLTVLAHILWPIT
jgi:hypothetical protein